MKQTGKYILGLIIFLLVVAGVSIMINRDKNNLLETDSQQSDESLTELQEKDNLEDDSIELSFDKTEPINTEQSENESTVISQNAEQNSYVDVQHNSEDSDASNSEEESEDTANSSNDGKKRTVYIEGVGEVELGPNELDFLPAD